MAHTYQWLPERKAKFTRAMKIGTVLNYFVLAGIIAYNLFYHPSASYTRVILGAAILVIIGVCINEVTKAGLRAEGFKLIISDEDITLQTYKRPDQTMRFDEIRQVKEQYNCLHLIDKRDGSPMLVISKSFGDFEGIKSIIADKGIPILTF